MTGTAHVLAVLEGVFLIAVGSLEAFGSHTTIFRRMFGVRVDAVPGLRVWIVNQGWYNLVFGFAFLAGGLLPLGTDAARTLLVVLALGQAVLGAVLLVSAPRLWRGAVVQVALPLAVLAALLL